MNIVNFETITNAAYSLIDACTSCVSRWVFYWIYPSLAINLVGVVAAIGIIILANKCVKYGETNRKTAKGKVVCLCGWTFRFFATGFGLVFALNFYQSAKFLFIFL